MIPWELYNLNQIFFWLWCHPEPHCGENPRWFVVCASKSTWFSLFHAPSVDWGAVHVCALHSLSDRGVMRGTAFPLFSRGQQQSWINWVHVVVGQEGEMVFDGDQSEGNPGLPCALAFLKGTSKEIRLLEGEKKKPPPFWYPTALCTNDLLGKEIHPLIH